MTLILGTAALYLIACLIHESGHALAAQSFGLPWKLVFNWLGPQAHIKGRYIWYENAAVALAGPLASFAGALAAWHLGLPFCAVFVALIGVGNLLPVPHSDLSNAVQALKLRRA